MRSRMPRHTTHHRWLRLIAAAAGISAIGLAVVASTEPGAGVGASAAMAASVTSAAAPVTSSARTVLLINGDRLAIAAAPGRARTATVLAGTTALAGTLVSLPIGGENYEVPADALPYLGHGLSPSLFDTGALAAREADGRLLVQIAYRGHLPALPGVTITTSGRGTATGYLTKWSSRRFGAALARQYLADRTRASYGTDGIFAGGVSIGLAGMMPGQVHVSRPERLMHTLTIRGTSLTGGPDTGDVVYLINLDSYSSSFLKGTFYHGVAKFSVSAGSYFVLADYLDLSRTGKLTAERVVTRPQVTVAGNATVRVAERAADSKVTMVTPRRAVTQATELTLIRTPRAGDPFVFVFYDQAPVSEWIAPAARPVSVGRLRVITDAWLTSPAGARPYDYDLAYQGRAGVIPRQHYLVRTASLATISARFYLAVHAPGLIARIGFFPGQVPGNQVDVGEFVNAPLLAVRLPQARTEYLSAGADLGWQTSLYAGRPAAPIGLQFDNFAFYRAGRLVTEDWNGFPLHSAVNTSPAATTGVTARVAAGLGPAYPSAERDGNTLGLLITPFSDDAPGHFGNGFGRQPGAAITGTYEIDQNGVKIAGGDATALNQSELFTSVTLSPHPAVISVVLNASRTGALNLLSTKTSTAWTWRSSRQPATEMPGGWSCLFGRNCTVQPMPALSYRVQGMALDGSVPPGAQVLDISAGHLQLAKAAPITGAKVQVSFDGGATWQDAAVTRVGAGDYRAAYSAPAGRYVTLRVTAADAASGSITETITRAYRSAS